MIIISSKNYIKLASNIGYWISPSPTEENSSGIFLVQDSHVITGKEIVKNILKKEDKGNFGCYKTLFDEGYIRIISRSYNFTIDSINLPNEFQINAIMSIVRKETPYEVQIIVGLNPAIKIEGGRINSIRQALLGKGKGKSKVYDIRNNPNYF